MTQILLLDQPQKVAQAAPSPMTARDRRDCADCRLSAGGASYINDRSYRSSTQGGLQSSPPLTKGR